MEYFGENVYVLKVVYLWSAILLINLFNKTFI